jgi:hypothetical protein
MNPRTANNVCIGQCRLYKMYIRVAYIFLSIVATYTLNAVTPAVNLLLRVTDASGKFVNDTGDYPNCRIAYTLNLKM